MLHDQEFLFNGTVGRLQVRFLKSSNITQPAALILHPHPLLGGTMNNVIICDIYKMLAKLDISVLRLNFRSVDKSQGTFDNGRGEVLDSAKALDFLIDKRMSAGCIIVIGYAFGAYVALQLAMRRPEISTFIVISPSIESFDYSFLTLCPAPGLILQGSEDVASDPYLSRELYLRLKQKNHNVEYQEIYGADHSFIDHRDTLQKYIAQYIHSCSFKLRSVIKKSRKQKKCYIK